MTLTVALDEDRATREAQRIEESRETIEELRASRRRLVLGGDADRRRIERAIHE
jgi:hypothetical protein